MKVQALTNNTILLLLQQCLAATSTTSISDSEGWCFTALNSITLPCQKLYCSVCSDPSQIHSSVSSGTLINKITCYA